MRLDSVTEDSILFNLSLKKFENESNISDNKLENQIINLFIDEGYGYTTLNITVPYYDDDDQFSDT